MGVGGRVLMEVLGEERIRLGWWDWGYQVAEEFRFLFRRRRRRCRYYCCCSFFLSAV